MEIPAARKLIDYLETKYNSGVSESTWTKIGSAINFIMRKNHQEKHFFLNGLYSSAQLPFENADGLTIFEFDATIINAWMFNLKTGLSGTTELDCKIKPQGSGSFTSIFSVTPKIASSAGDNAWVGVGDVGTGLVAPVFAGGGSTLNVNKGDGLRVDLLQAQPSAESCGLLIHYRPR